jgi:phosphatidylserine/phosphatidylglycerophosphate/cardiolipin synthase-like enzyme
MHNKVIVIDERTVITGSYNFTGSAEKDNDENLVIVDDPNLARAYLDEFQRVYDQAQSPTRCR